MMDTVLKKWIIRLRKAETGHYLASEFYKKINFFLGIIIVISSTFVTATLYFSPENISEKNLVIIISISSTVFAGIYSLLKPYEKAEKHRSSATKYGILKRKLEFLLIDSKKISDLDNQLSEIKNTWNNIAENSPLTPQFFRRRAGSIIKQDISEISELEE